MASGKCQDGVEPAFGGKADMLRRQRTTLPTICCYDVFMVARSIGKADTVVLDMIDWRDCPAVEYVPGRVSGQPSFVRLRLQVSIFVDWIAAGHSIEEFEDGFHVGLEHLQTVADYLRNDPPRHRVDLTGCAHIAFGPDGDPVFESTGMPVEILFDHIKAGVTPRQFADSYGLDYEHIEAVLAHDTAPRPALATQ